MHKASKDALTVAAAALAIPIAYSFFEPHRLLVRHFNVLLENLPDEAEGMRIVQLSDLHISAISSLGFIRRALKAAVDLRPDLFVMTGDYVSRRNSYLPFTGARVWARPVMEYAERMAEAVSILRPVARVLAVPGNHDVANGNADAIGELLESVGIEILTNRNTRERGLVLAGIDDMRAGRPNLTEALRGIEEGEAQVILSHNPRVAPLVAERNSLILAGHTHAGQVHLPLTGFRRRPSDMKRSPYFQGWYQVGRAQLYVNSGLGSVHFPVRFDCPPEIALFTLQKRKH